MPRKSNNGPHYSLFQGHSQGGPGRTGERLRAGVQGCAPRPPAIRARLLPRLGTPLIGCSCCAVAATRLISMGHRIRVSARDSAGANATDPCAAAMQPKVCSQHLAGWSRCEEDSIDYGNPCCQLYGQQRLTTAHNGSWSRSKSSANTNPPEEQPGRSSSSSSSSSRRAAGYKPSGAGGAYSLDS
jgi:hypothetical protein